MVARSIVRPIVRQIARAIAGIAPDAPIGVSATGGVAQATVSFSQQGGVATGFVVRASSGSAPLATNRRTWSEDLANAVYIKVNASVSQDATMAPDGTMTMDKIVETATNAAHYVALAAPTDLTAATVTTCSVILRAGERSRATLRVDAALNSTAAIQAFNFDLVTGATGATTGTGFTFGASVLPGGYVRAWITFTTAASLVGGNVLVAITVSNTASMEPYSGDGASGIFAWGVQIENASAMTSYQRQDASGTRNHPIEFGSASPITMTGLAAAASYTFTVQAFNSSGSYSAQSEASNSVTPS